MKCVLCQSRKKLGIVYYICKKHYLEHTVELAKIQRFTREQLIYKRISITQSLSEIQEMIAWATNHTDYKKTYIDQLYTRADMKVAYLRNIEKRLYQLELSTG